MPAAGIADLEECMTHLPRTYCLPLALAGGLLAAALSGADEPAPRGESERDRLNGDVARQLVSIIRDDGGPYPPPARAAAAQTLGRMGIDARAVVPELTQILNDPLRCYPFVVDEAIVRAVGDIGLPARPAIPALVRNVGKDRDLDRAVQESVARILSAAHVSEEVAVLARLLKSADPGERLRAAKQLFALGPDARAALPELTAALLDPDRDVSRQVLLALQAIRPGAGASKQAIGVYARDLSDPDEAVRLRAAKALAKLGPAARPALPALQAAARNDPDEDVRRVAADAIARIQQGGGGGAPLP